MSETGVIISDEECSPHTPPNIRYRFLDEFSPKKKLHTITRFYGDPHCSQFAITPVLEPLPAANYTIHSYGSTDNCSLFGSGTKLTADYALDPTSSSDVGESMIDGTPSSARHSAGGEVEASKCDNEQMPPPPRPVKSHKRPLERSNGSESSTKSAKAAPCISMEGDGGIPILG